jgi:cytochrome c-type biogenesis protein CcmH
VIVFSMICILMVGVAVALVVSPLRHPDRVAGSSTSEANLAVYRRQLAEMESDCRHQIISPGQFRRERGELEQRLIVDLPNDSRVSRSPRTESRSATLVYVLAVALPLTAVLLYLTLGTPEFLLSP